MLMYTVAMDMQPSRGDTSSRAQTPQKVNRVATEMMSRLSVDRFLGMSHFMMTPKSPPKRKTPVLTARGARMLLGRKEPERTARAMEMETL